MRKFFIGVLFATMMLTGVSSALAISLSMNSEITFGGTIKAGSNLQTATSLAFSTPTFVTSASGSFAGISSPGDLATFNGFSFNPFTGDDNPVWSTGGFQFDLKDINVNTQNANSLVLLGSGIVTGNGFDPTTFSFSLSADRISSAVAFSATTAPLATPEPGTLFLLGTAIIGLSRFAKGQKSA